MFHTARTGEPEKFMCLMVWRNGKTEDTWHSYGWKVVAFGDCPSSCVLEIAKDLTALAGEDIDKVAARCISKNTYMDDGATSGDEETADKLIGEVSINEDGLLTYTGTLSQIFQKGGFRLKMIVRSGETNLEALRRMGGTVLGHKWSPTEDTFTFQPKAYMGKKARKGAYNGPQLLPENLDLNDSFEWTKAVVLLIVTSIFDPLSLISAYVIKYKLFLREVCLDKKIGWSDPLPPALMERWRSLTKELVCTPPIIINRCA